MYTAIADDIKERMDKGIIDIGLLAEPVDISKYSFLRLKKKGTVGRSCAIGFGACKKICGNAGKFGRRTAFDGKTSAGKK